MLLIANLVQFSFWWLRTKQSAGYVFMAQKANRWAKSAQVYLDGLLTNGQITLLIYTCMYLNAATKRLINCLI